jgi:hypothetical protein
MGRIPAVALLAGLLFAAAAPADAALRPDDPVVLTGAKLPRLAGEQPGTIVAFAWDTRWRQVPVQVDERATIDFGRVYDGHFRAGAGQTTLSYVDPAAPTGGDPDATFDADDELAFMAADAGRRAPSKAGRPAGVRGLPGAEVRLRDPLDQSKGSVYLFARAKGLSQGAGRRYVSYRFTLLAGAYPAAYRFDNGGNPENSVIKTKAYEVRFADRWQMDSLRIRSKGSSSADILDRYRAQFAPGSCGRSEDTFDAAEGAFIVNKSGPVRAIRSYVGANSGPLTQRQHVFYADRQDITTFLRVHAIPSVMEVFDYAPAAIGMTYRNDLVPAGVRVDGAPDSVPAGRLAWEQVSGAPGTLTMVHRLETTVAPLTVSSYYADTATPAASERPCTGDTQLLGVSGPRVTSPIPNTDPRTPGAARLTTMRTLYADPPGGTAALAQRRAREAATPLVAKVGPVGR